MKKKLTPIITTFLLASCTFSLPDIPKSSPTPSEAPLSSLESGPSSEPSSSTSGSSSSPKDSDDFAPEGYSLSWADEFDGECLNLDNWSYEIGNGNGGWGNQEAQYYTDHNDEVKDGKLIISAKKERVSDWDYTSTRIRTKGKVATTYGYIAARIKLSAVAGLWPAFWMLPEEGYGDSGVTWWPTSGEIDIMENKGRDATHTSSAIHFASDGNGGTHTYLSGSATVDNIENYHVYAVEWTPTAIRFSVDGEKTFSRPRGAWNGGYGSDDAPFNKDFHLLLNLAVAGQFDNFTYPPEGWTKSDMMVDYVRIYHSVDAE